MAALILGCRASCDDATRGAALVVAARAAAANYVPLYRLETLCLDGNHIGTMGHTALARVLALGAAPSLGSLFVDRPERCACLQEACARRGVELSAW